uniref:Uncharacterized protein n=1 Tax=Ixodes ricinus TaxID=34613 RepID=A0A6B0UCI7_IXORI
MMADKVKCWSLYVRSVTLWVFFRSSTGMCLPLHFSSVFQKRRTIFLGFFSNEETWASLAIIIFSWNLDLRIGFFSIPRFLAGYMFFVLAMGG